MHNLCSYLTLISWQCGANGLCQSRYCTRLSEHQSNELHWTHTDTVRSENLQDYNNWHVPDSCSCKTTEESSTLMQMTWKMQELSRLMPALSHGCYVGGACNRNIFISLNLVDVWPTKIFWHWRFPNVWYVLVTLFSSPFWTPLGWQSRPHVQAPHSFFEMASLGMWLL